MKRKIYNLMMILCIVLFLTSAFMLVKHYYIGIKNWNAFEKVTEIVTNEDSESKEKVITAYEKYEGVYDKNSDFIGWIAIDDTKINYPVMQTKDKPNYYLNHSFDKKESVYGVPYVAEGCDVDNSQNIIIYGHNMKDGSMFAELGNYTSKDFYEEHKIIKFDTLEGYGEYEVLSVFKIKAVVEEEFKYYNFINASNEAEFNEFISKCKELSLYDTAVTAKYEDKLLTLSTCEYSQDNGRLVVVAKKIK